MAIRASVQMTMRPDDVLEQVMERVRAGQNMATEQLLADSIDEAPQQTRAMVGGAHVDPAGPGDDSAAVVYDAPQAARLHEHPEYNFSTDVNPRAKGKFLEDPAVQNRKRYGDIIRTEARRG